MGKNQQISERSSENPEGGTKTESQQKQNPIFLGYEACPSCGMKTLIKEGLCSYCFVCGESSCSG